MLILSEIENDSQIARLSGGFIRQNKNYTELQPIAVYADKCVNGAGFSGVLNVKYFDVSKYYCIDIQYNRMNIN